MGVLEDVEPHVALEKAFLSGGRQFTVKGQMDHDFVLSFFFWQNVASWVASQAVGLRFTVASIQHHGS